VTTKIPPLPRVISGWLRNSPTISAATRVAVGR
jgi:hypothetical protein